MNDGMVCCFGFFLGIWGIAEEIFLSSEFVFWLESFTDLDFLDSISNRKATIFRSSLVGVTFILISVCLLICSMEGFKTH